MALAPLLLLTQGHAGDRLGAALIPALRQHFPQREIWGLGGSGMEAAGARLVSRADGISVMGWTGVLTAVPQIVRTLRRVAEGTRHPVPACVIAVDVWQPLRHLHQRAPHLAALPHICYLPPGPNFIAPTRVHRAAAAAFREILTPFPHQAELYRGAGATVSPAAHAGLFALRRDIQPLPSGERRPWLALLPGSRDLEVRYSLTVQKEAAQRITARHPELQPVVCCASEAVERESRRLFPELPTRRDTRQVLAEARFGILCSGTAVLEAAVLGCPGVVTYHGSPLQRWEWHTFHVPKLRKLRAAGIASPYISLPNILLGAEVYPELPDAPAEQIAARSLQALDEPPEVAAARMAEAAALLYWNEPGEAVAQAVARALAAEPT